jgi:hypothetical protein
LIEMSRKKCRKKAGTQQGSYYYTAAARLHIPKEAGRYCTLYSICFQLLCLNPGHRAENPAILTNRFTSSAKVPYTSRLDGLLSTIEQQCFDLFPHLDFPFASAHSEIAHI